MGLKPEIASQILLETLSNVASVKSVDTLQTGALMSVIDAFDRRIKREEFNALLSEAFMLFGSVGKLRMAVSIRDKFDGKTLTKALLDDAIKLITVDGETFREKLRAKITLQVQCPVEGENPIH